MLESVYQAQLIKKLRLLFPGCIILKNDSSYMQGVPDLTILWGKKWAMLEVKPYEDAPIQPNQDYYVEKLNEASFAAFIYPENEADTLHALQRAFQALGRHARVPEPLQLPLDELRRGQTRSDVPHPRRSSPRH